MKEDGRGTIFLDLDEEPQLKWMPGIAALFKKLTCHDKENSLLQVRTAVE